MAQQPWPAPPFDCQAGDAKPWACSWWIWRSEVTNYPIGPKASPDPGKESEGYGAEGHPRAQEAALSHGSGGNEGSPEKRRNRSLKAESPVHFVT
jgi:hypothetical protein